MKAVILAGGGGTRLWPLSREDFPKQFLRFGSRLSLLQETVERLSHASFIDDIVVSTNALYLPLVEQQIKKMGLQEQIPILVEPYRRNTAPAIALAVKYLQDIRGAQLEESVLVVPSDQWINPGSAFLEALSQADKEMPEGSLITFGIRPTRPETGYGYIQIGSKCTDSLFQVHRFVEKPSLLKAQDYLTDSTFYWNAGIFLFRYASFWQQLSVYAPELSALASSYEEMQSVFERMPNISIDYALMEKSSEIVLCPLAVAWSDLGSWDSVYSTLDKDPDQNVKVGKVVSLDTKNCLIMSHHRRIATVGLEDLLIVETEDSILIAKRGESQRVKQLVEKTQK